ncbi:STAS domain-containing protein [Amycolatopsis sp. Hca4]|uniref:STAS domain-containing protein n=1 Tax=unclassified Amycolatopsis TaxID=2618356 RepID=UPI001591258E|nr:STAS domain-containing protein [Amycolatopsis sp. Hca4]QKV73749.1 STAS domain-containing protein [Amycolatopsis sp. Hca4]
MKPGHPPMPAAAVRSIGDIAVLEVGGDVDHVVRSTLRAAMEAALARNPRALVVDLSRVGFFASAGLSALAWLHEAAGKAGIDVALVATQRSVLRPLAITRVDDLFDIHRTVDAAVERFGAPEVRGHGD